MKQNNFLLYYKSPAKNYNNGLPIGTGRLAGMVCGSIEEERLALNHEWLWRGLTRNREPQKSADKLQYVRQLLLEGKYAEGTIEGNKAFAGDGGIIAREKPCRTDAYQPAGDFRFAIKRNDKISNYYRELNLNNGLVQIKYKMGKKEIVVQYFASLTHDLIFMRVYCEQNFSGDFYITRIDDPLCFTNYRIDDNSIIFEGNFEGGIAFCIKALLLKSDGETIKRENCIQINNAKEAIFAIDVGTSAKCEAPEAECDRHLQFRRDVSWETLFAAHRAKYSRLYKGISLTIKGNEPELTTDERIKRLREGGDDPLLPVLYFNFCRYLLLTSTARAELPPNLQGKWNEELNPPWASDYHLDINLQMNCWAIEHFGMHCAFECLMRFIEWNIPHAKKAARDLYGCRGVFFPLTLDAWGRSTPESFGWAVWIGGAAWLAQHVWWHYEFTLDKEFLRKRAYPFFKEVVAFYEDYCIEGKDGKLIIVPSQSPENKFNEASDMPVSLCFNSAMDIQLARNALKYALNSAKILGVDSNLQQKWQNMLNKMPQLKIGSKGQLLEWNEEFEETEPGHRHLSHLIGLYPDATFTKEKTPKLFEAAAKSFDIRLKENPASNIGWNTVWSLCILAILHRNHQIWQYITSLIKDISTDTLLGVCLDKFFQIDSMLGYPAAVVEMLLHSYENILEFLPALPPQWNSGSIKGLRARGCLQVNISWHDCKLTIATIQTLKETEFFIKDHCQYKVTIKRGSAKISEMPDGLLKINAQAGVKLVIRSKK